MTISARRFLAACAGALLLASLSGAAFLHAQEVAELSVPSGQPSAAPATVTEKVAGTIEGIKSGDISTAREAAVFDRLLSYTLIRISDCWTLCKQEMILAKESANREAVQTAKGIFRKSVDAATEQGREAILDKLPTFAVPENDGKSGD